jgi:hypothetical protein
MYLESFLSKYRELQRFRYDSCLNSADARRVKTPSDQIWHYWDYNILFPPVNDCDIGTNILNIATRKPIHILDVFSQGFFFTRHDILHHLPVNSKLVTLDINDNGNIDDNRTYHVTGDFFDSKSYRNQLALINPLLQFDVVIANPGGVMIVEEQAAHIYLTNMVLNKLWRLTAEDGILYCAFEKCLFPYPQMFDLWIQKLSSKLFDFAWRTDTTFDHTFSFWIQKNGSRPLPMLY